MQPEIISKNVFVHEDYDSLHHSDHHCNREDDSKFICYSIEGFPTFCEEEEKHENKIMDKNVKNCY